MSTTKKKVAKKKKITKNQFKKGKSGNPFGRPKMSEAEKELSLKTRTQFKNILNKYMISSEKELEKLYRDKSLPAIDGMIIKSMLNAFRSGDQTQINWFLNHSLGKEKETTNINLSGSVDSMNPKDFTKEELLAMKAIHESKKNREDK